MSPLLHWILGSQWSSPTNHKGDHFQVIAFILNYIALLMNFAKSVFIRLSEGMWMYIICPAS